MTEEKKEGKTIFEYMGGFLGTDKQDGKKLINKYKSTLKTIIFMVIAGFIVGVILDTTLGTSNFTTVVPLLFCLVFLVKWYKGSQGKK